jgi:hypothetical protein
LRQTDSGAEISSTPEQPLTSSQVLRVANLTMDDQGVVTGKIDLTFFGAPALRWRQVALRQDRAGLEDRMQRSVEEMMPAGMEVKVAKIDDVTDYEKPLVASFTVKGSIGSATGKRLLIPGDIFESRTKPTFSHEKREQGIYFEYPYMMRDAVRVNFPKTFSVESLPAGETAQYQKSIAYGLKTEQTPSSVTFRREFDIVDILYKSEEYKDLRAFYSKFETKDQENVVLKFAADSSGNTKASTN